MGVQLGCCSCCLFLCVCVSMRLARCSRSCRSVQVAPACAWPFRALLGAGGACGASVLHLGWGRTPSTGPWGCPPVPRPLSHRPHPAPAEGARELFTRLLCGARRHSMCPVSLSEWRAAAVKLLPRSFKRMMQRCHNQGGGGEGAGPPGMYQGAWMLAPDAPTSNPVGCRPPVHCTRRPRLLAAPVCC